MDDFDSQQYSSKNNGNKFLLSAGSSFDQSELEKQAGQLLDTTQTQTAMQNYADMIKQKMSFYGKVKRSDQPKFAELASCDEKLSFFKECLKNHILSFPYLSHISNNTLVL